jgi:hypothetical protein
MSHSGNAGNTFSRYNEKNIYTFYFCFGRATEVVGSCWWTGACWLGMRGRSGVVGGGSCCHGSRCEGADLTLVPYQFSDLFVMIMTADHCY